MSAVIEPADAAHAAPAAAHGHDPHAEHKVRNITFIKVAIFLAIITALETSTYWWPDDMHTVGMVVLFVSMIIKFFVILLWFMHLKWDSWLFSMLFYIGLFLAVAVYVVALFTFKFFA